MDAAQVERLVDLVEEIAGDPVVRTERDMDLFDEGLFDSMAAIEFLVDLEDRFGVSIAPTEVAREEMNTVNLIIQRVVERL